MLKLTIEPQKNISGDPSETEFVPSSDEEAGLWAVFDVSDERMGDAELVEDFVSREAAESFIAQKMGAEVRDLLDAASALSDQTASELSGRLFDRFIFIRKLADSALARAEQLAAGEWVE